MRPENWLKKITMNELLVMNPYQVADMLLTIKLSPVLIKHKKSAKVCPQFHMFFFYHIVQTSCLHLLGK